jgi:DNA-binding transcriptional MerR regulator
MARKNCFTISEIAKEFKVKNSHIRSYEKKGLISPRNNKLNRRIYNQHDRARLELISHFELINYSLDQISELIGILDVNLDKMEQFRKSLEYGEKKLDELEKRSKEIKFPDKISVMNEINMMREYAEVLKNIDPLKLVTEKKLKRKPIRMISVYVGLSLILILPKYFFYQGGKILSSAQKKQSKTEASLVYRYPVPPDDTENQQKVSSQPSETPNSLIPIQGDSYIEESKELVNKEPTRDKAETVVLSKAALNIGVGFFPLLSTEATDAIIDFEGFVFSPERKDLKVLKEKVRLKESASGRIEEETGLTERAEAGLTLQADPLEDQTKSGAPPEPSDSLLKIKKPIEKKFSNVKETVKAEKEEKIIQVDMEISSSPIETISKEQITAPAKNEKKSVAKVEEKRPPEIVALAVSTHKEAPPDPEQPEPVSSKDKPNSDTQVNEDDPTKLQHIDSNVTQLPRKVARFDGKKQPEYKPLIFSHVEKTKLDTVQDKTQLDNYTVSLYYTSEKNKELIEYLSILLQLEGFNVLEMERADYQNNDIRYFHSEDKAGALLLQKYSTEFITPFMNLEDTNIKIKDLSQKYPNAQKGGLEVWLNNNFLR